MRKKKHIDRWIDQVEGLIRPSNREAWMSAGKAIAIRSARLPNAGTAEVGSEGATLQVAGRLRADAVVQKYGTSFDVDGENALVPSRW